MKSETLTKVAISIFIISAIGSLTLLVLKGKQ